MHTYTFRIISKNQINENCKKFHNMKEAEAFAKALEEFGYQVFLDTVDGIIASELVSWPTESFE